MRAFAFALLLGLTLVLTFTAFAADFNVPPAPTQRVTDNAGILSDGTRTAIETELKSYESSTGHQIVVWIGQTTGDVPLETWTVEAANQWKIGRKGHDDGAILFIFNQDHKVRIEVGYGLESALTDADSHRIITDDIVPRMRAGDPNGAVSSGVAAMLTTITPSYKTSSLPSPSPQPAQSPIGTGIAIAVVVIIVCTFAFLIFMTILQVIGMIRYGYLVLREGSKQAKADMKRSSFWGGFLGGVASSGFSGGSSSDFGGGDFGGGGGSFGGGGASGGW
jgi:uncharacterized protein